MARSIKATFEAQLEHAKVVNQTTASERIDKLKRLRKALTKYKQEIIDVIKLDFNKPEVETILTEIFVINAEIKHTISHLRSWMKPNKVSRPLFLPTLKGKVEYKPKGVSLIISPWNFPLNLALGPLVSAIAAGNCVCLKPSELSPNTSQFIYNLLEDLFPPEEVSVFLGDKNVSQQLLNLPFHHIFFTGSPRVGKIVMKAAAEHLSDVTLELGGKSPAIVDRHADIDKAAKAIAWGKFLNAGQTCVAPDYALVHKSVETEFHERLNHYLSSFAKEDSDYSSIISDDHWSRIVKAIDEAEKKGATITYGGDRKDTHRYIQPTVCTNVPADATLMREEIFGPVLPVLTFNDLDEALSIVNDKERPLAQYIFSSKKSTIRQIQASTIAGGVAINDVILQFCHTHLPFGGVNYSGIGRGHGEWGFKSFSHEQAVVDHSAKWNPMNLLYPPYTDKTKSIANLFLKYFG